MMRRFCSAFLFLLLSIQFAQAEVPGAEPKAVTAPASTGLTTVSPGARSGPGVSAQGTRLPTVTSQPVVPPLPSGEGTPTGLPGNGTGDGAPSGAENSGSDPASANAEMSLNETLMSAEDSGVRSPQPFRIGKLTQFGYSFFRQPTAFAPTVDIPVGPDYVIGPGDTLLVTTWGSLDATLPLEVNRSGEVTLPRVGAVKVWGVPFAKVPEVIRGALGQTFKNVQLNVTMGKLRLMKVYIVGEVNAPGDYDISALSTVINALAAAGGPTKQGTLRAIEVLRAGKIVDTVDLYDFFLKGDKSRDIRLQPGDTINVPIHGNLVGIAGNARKPAIYEFRNSLTLKELFEMAGGISSSSYLQRIQISRVLANDKKIVADFNLDPKLSGQSLDAQTAAVQLQDMDIVKIFPIDFRVRDHVQLDGYVLRPGSYALKEGMRLKDLIGPDNLLPEYYGPTVEITRLVGTDFHPEKIYVNLDLALQGETDDNIALQEFDSVRVFSRWEMEEVPTVTVSGDVQKPGAYRVFDKMTLRDLIFAAGNVKKTAYLQNAEITRTIIDRSGVKSHIINVDLGQALKGDPQANIPITEFDEVVVRRVPEWKDVTDRYCTLSGEVRFPGVYPIIRGETLSSVIERAGGFTGKAYLRGAKFTRKLTREIQQKRMDEVITRTEQDLMRKQQELSSVAASKEELEATKATLEGMRASLEKLRQAKAEGRVSISITSLKDLQESLYDLELQGGDALEIPQSSKSVMVFGEVYNPTTVIESPGATVGDYLKKAGGPTTNADEAEMYVVLADGTVVSKREMGGIFFNPFKSYTLQAGDAIVVPQRLEKVAWMRDLKDLAYIIGQTALAAGVLVAAGL